MAEEVQRLLSKTGFQGKEHSIEDLKWIDDVPGTSEFRSWLGTISDDNILSPQELQMYEYLKKENKLYEGDIDKALMQYMTEDVPDTSNDLSFLKSEIKEKESELSRLTSLKKSLSIQVAALDEEDTDQETNCENLLLKEKEKFKTNVQLYTSDLENLRSLFCAEHENILKICSGEMQTIPIHDEDSVRQFIDVMRVCLSYANNVADRFYKEEPQDNFNCLDDFHKINSRLMDLEKEIVYKEADIAAIDSILNYSRETWTHVCKNEKLCGEEQKDVSSQVADLCKKLVQTSFRSKQLEFVQERKLELLKVHKSTEELKAMAKQIRIYFDCFSLILKNMSDYVSVSVLLLKDTLESLQDLQKTNVERLGVDKELPKCNHSLPSILDLFPPDDSRANVHNIHDSLIKQKEIALDNFKTLHSHVNHVINYVQNVDEAVFNGPTRRPVLLAHLKETLGRIELDLNQHNSNLESSLKKFRKFQSSLDIDNDKKKLHTLWSDYLKNKSKTLEELEKLEEFVSCSEITISDETSFLESSGNLENYFL